VEFNDGYSWMVAWELEVFQDYNVCPWDFCAMLAMGGEL